MFQNQRTFLEFEFRNFCFSSSSSSSANMTELREFDALLQNNNTHRSCSGKAHES